MTGRADLAVHIAELVGGDLLEITDPGSGWPALGTLVVDDDPLAVSLFVGPVGLSHRSRDDVERRFQNPGQNRPIVLSDGRYPLLLGLFEEDSQMEVPRPLLVQADPHRRVGRITRYSVFVSVTALREASATGWSEDITNTGEVIRCLLPPLLPVSVSAALDDVVPPSNAMQAAINGSGLLDFPVDETPAAERARRAGTTLVRDARFARRVTLAYDGFCAMCGLDANLIQGAHIYPASAPGSQDEPWNGLALCPNHHLAFDRHLIAVHPGTRKIIFNPELRRQAESSRAMSAFITGTFEQLTEPTEQSARPRTEMFTSRYRHFPDNYNWLGAAGVPG
jgi:HNH endonuclease